jgi:hypothetical protein
MIDKLIPKTFKSDQDERLTPPTAFIDALNITLDDDEEGNAGIVKNIKGTSTVIDSTGIDYSSETIQVLGTCRDSERSRTYIFVYCTTSSKQAILQYSDSNNTITTVISGNKLNFVSGSCVVANVINGDFRRDNQINSLLYFTDDENPPRKINVDHASDLQALPGGSSFDKGIQVLKGTALSAPKPWLLRDPSISSVSNFQRGSFQFAFQYIYKDGEVSALSPYSKYVFANKRIEPESTISTLENVCKVSLPFGDLTQEVFRVRLLFRENNGYEVSPFRIIDEFSPFETITRNLGDQQGYTIFDSSSNVYTFLNNGYNGFLPSSEEDRPYSNVPKRAKTQTIINSRLVYGNYVDGFDNLGDPDSVEGSNGEKPDVDFDVTYHPIPTGNTTTIVSPQEDIQGETGIVIAESQNSVNISGGNTVVLNFTDTLVASNSASCVVGNAANKVLSAVVWTDDDDNIKVATLDSLSIGMPDFEVEITLGAQESMLNGIDSVMNQLNDQLEESTEITTSHFPGQNVHAIITDLDGVEYKLFYKKTTKYKLFNVGGDLVLRRVLTSILPMQVMTMPDNPLEAEIYNVEQFTTGYSQSNASHHSMSCEEFRITLTTKNPSHFASFTSGSNHTIAFSYIDSDGRYGPAQEVGSFFVEPIGASERGGNNGPVTVQMTPRHTPPAWAEKYAVLYAGPDDIEESFDMYVDDATMIRKTTKNFPFEKPDSVFVNITSYTESLTRQGIDFNSVYKFEPGDYVRIISKRNTTTTVGFNIENIDPSDGSGGTINPHTVESTTTFWDALSENLRPAGPGTTVDFPVLGIHEISSTTDIDDYPFGTDAIGRPVGGVYLELEVPRDAVGWGSDFFQFLAGPREVRGEQNVGSGLIFRNIIGSGGTVGGTLTGGAFESWWGVSGTTFGGANGLGVNNADADGDLSSVNQDWANAGQIPWKVLFRDDDTADENEQLKQLHRYLSWDKGIRMNLIKPKNRSKSRVYHEIGVFKTFDDKGSQPPNPHGVSQFLQDGYSWFRRVDSSAPFDGTTTVNFIAFTGPDQEDEDNATSTFTGTTNGASDPTRRDTFQSSYGGRVRPIQDESNHVVESFYTFPGSLEKIRNIGRLNVTSLDGEKRRESSLLHSNFFGSESLFLTVHDFEATSFKDLDSNFGAVNAISDTDQYITVFQNSKVSKVPVNRNIIQTAGGSESLTVSNQVFGAEQSYVGNLGVDTNQSALINVDNVLYFIDTARRSIVKVSNQGMNILSDIDISRMIEETFISNAGNKVNYALGYDRERGYVFFTFQGSRETYGYDHVKKVWTSKYSFAPLSYALCENDMLSFSGDSNGNIAHRHDNESSPGNFYGSNYSSKISLISAGRNPSVVKAYNAIGLESTIPMDVKITNRDQSVSFDKDRFNEKERSYYTDIPFDGSHRIKIYGYLDEADITDAQKETLVESVNPSEIRIVGSIKGIATLSTPNNGFPFNVNPAEGFSSAYGISIFRTAAQESSGDLEDIEDNPGSSTAVELINPAYHPLTVLAFLYKGKWRVMDSLFRSAIGFGNPNIAYQTDPGDFQGGDGLLNNSMVIQVFPNSLPQPIGEFSAMNNVVLGISKGHTLSPSQMPSGDTPSDKMATYEQTIRDWLSSKGIINDFTTAGDPLPVAFVDLNSDAFGSTGTAPNVVYDYTSETPTVGGKKVRDHYARVDLTSEPNGKKFELYAATLDYDDSKIHM